MRKAAGFTLVEVMVGIVLAAILVLGLSTLWVVVGDTFLRLTLRQKAIFALSGETERLAAYYASPTAGFNLTGCVVPAAKVDNILLPTTVLRPGLIGATVNTYATACATPGVLAAGHVTTTAASFDVGQVYVPAGGPPNYNLVWLDKDKNLAASLFWVATQSSDPSLPHPTYGTTAQWLNVYMQYPYRYIPGAGNVPVAVAPLEWVSVSTIVGPRGMP